MIALISGNKYPEPILMNKKYSAILLLFVFAMVLTATAQEKVFLIPDRTSCVSGDTVWFTTTVFDGTRENVAGNVVHVQLDKLDGKHITRVNIVSNEITGHGFLPVPDSLSSGTYVLKAFTNVQMAHTSAVVHQRLLTVYNRFDTEISSIDYPEFTLQDFDQLNEIRIVKNKGVEGSKSVSFTINIPEEIQNEAEEMIVTARLADVNSEAFSTGWVSTPIVQKEAAYMPFREKNGLLIKGKIFSNQDGKEVQGAKIILSISDTLPYFDYCISDSLGRFYFYLRNAYGIGDIIVQELTDTPSLNSIEFYENYIETPAFVTSQKYMNNEERSYAEDLIKAAYFDRFFKTYNKISTDTFSISTEFSYPFYGKPTASFYPEEFIDLPDFQEISREILRGVQYRERKDEVTIRLFDHGTDNIFNDEPFKLLDGVPVFDPKIFSDMGTSRIKKVDAVFYKQYFGDLGFSGVLAVYTHQPSTTWVENIEGVNLIRYQCLQPESKWNFKNTPTRRTNTPDFKKVFFRKTWTEVSPSETINFDTSDIQGDIVVDVIVIGKQQNILQHHKVFENR